MKSRFLPRAVNDLQAWLDYKSTLTLWLPTININAKIEVSRMDILKISGNHCKHNISRLTSVSRNIHKILLDHKYSVPIEIIPLALDDFREHLDENIFLYYGTWMSQLLNDVLWGIQAYLQPMYNSCCKYVTDGGSYHYDYPEGFEGEISKQWFWRLMNHIRSRPNVDKFLAPDRFKAKSSLERDFQ